MAQVSSNLQGSPYTRSPGFKKKRPRSWLFQHSKSFQAQQSTQIETPSQPTQFQAKSFIIGGSEEDGGAEEAQFRAEEREVRKREVGEF